jgi:hypothetical protein
MMKLLCTVLVASGVGIAGPALARADRPHSDRERKEDIARHRALAAAHEAAARCLESGRPEKECLAQLAKDCKGLGIGKYCGMKHKH